MGAGPDEAGNGPMSDAELLGLLRDCLKLWETPGRVVVRDEDVAIETTEGVFSVRQADPALRPVRWFYQTPERAAAGRPPRAAPSIVALLSALRNALGGMKGASLRIGGA
jgi:hypothetical protein